MSVRLVVVVVEVVVAAMLGCYTWRIGQWAGCVGWEEVRASVIRRQRDVGPACPARTTGSVARHPHHCGH